MLVRNQISAKCEGKGRKNKSVGGGGGEGTEIRVTNGSETRIIRVKRHTTLHETHVALKKQNTNRKLYTLITAIKERIAKKILVKTKSTTY